MEKKEPCWHYYIKEYKYDEECKTWLLHTVYNHAFEDGKDELYKEYERLTKERDSTKYRYEFKKHDLNEQNFDVW